MPLSNLINDRKKLILFGGKGGVGKTTSAAAFALKFAQMGKPTLIISSDPAPSLSDIFETEIGDKERLLKGVENLSAVEISADSVLERWKKKFGPEVYEVLSSFIPVEYEIIDYFASAPGIEEEFMLDYILELLEDGRYETVIWDTAPAGHTLRLLSLPQTFLTHLEAAAKIYMKFYGYLKKLAEFSKITRKKRSIFAIIDKWKGLSERILNFLRDETRTEFIVVAMPEALSVYQTGRIIDFSREFGLTLKHIIINNVIKVADGDFLKTRKKMQQVYLEAMEERYGKEMKITEIPLAPYEIKGIERISQISKVLFSSFAP
jgi:arsenite-transporting ATPase